MIENKLCQNCEHLYVCNKLKTIDKFENETKGFINVDIKMLRCLDFDGTGEENQD